MVLIYSSLCKYTNLETRGSCNISYIGVYFLNWTEGNQKQPRKDAYRKSIGMKFQYNEMNYSYKVMLRYIVNQLTQLLWHHETYVWQNNSCWEEKVGERRAYAVWFKFWLLLGLKNIVKFCSQKTLCMTSHTTNNFIKLEPRNLTWRNVDVDISRLHVNKELFVKYLYSWASLLSSTTTWLF